MSHYEGGTEGKGDVDDGASNHSPTSSSKKLKSVSTSAPSLIHTDKDDNKTCSNSTNNQTDLPLRHAIPLDMVVLGAVNAGKTALVKRILHGTFWEEPPDWTQSSGAVYYSKTMTVQGTLLKIKIWDTAGDEKYKFLLPMYYKSAQVAIIVFDIDDEASLEKAKSLLVELKDADCCKVTALVAAKSDTLELKGDDHPAKSYAAFQDAVYKEVSAATGEGVNALFEELCARALHRLKRDKSMLSAATSRGGLSLSVLGVNTAQVNMDQSKNQRSSNDKTEHGHRRVTSIELRRDNGSTYVLEDELSDGTGTVEDIRYNWLPMCGCGDVMFAPILALTLRISASGNDSLFTDIKHNTMDVAETSSHERRPRWTPDEAAHSCRKCGSSFGVFLRKHHCRNCGHIFCSDCSSRYTMIPRLGYNKAVRVCDDCHGALSRGR